MMTFTSVLEGYKKEDAREGGGSSFQFQGPSFKFRAQVKSPLEYFSASPHWVSQEFLHQSNYPVFSFLFYGGHTFLFDWTLFLLTFLAWMAIELVYPAILTWVPDNKHHHFISVDRG